MSTAALPASPTAAGIAVRLRGVTKAFGTGDARVQALRGIDLDVPMGEIVMVVGPSGCGKTTLISIIAATLDSDSGEVDAFGQRLDRYGQRKKTLFRRNNVGFIFQQYNLLPGLTSAENVAVPLTLNGVHGREAMDRARAMLDRVGIASKWNQPPSSLSGGQQQRVAIARALVHEPRLLVCDEPTAALDGETGRQVLGILREVAVKPGRSVIIVTHDNRVFPFGDRFAFMADGRVERVALQGEDLHT